jgi:hypothetical protein
MYMLLAASYLPLRLKEKKMRKDILKNHNNLKNPRALFSANGGCRFAARHPFLCSTSYLRRSRLLPLPIP